MGIKSNCLVFAATAALPVGECLNFRVALGLQQDKPSDNDNNLPEDNERDYVSKGEFFKWLTETAQDKAMNEAEIIRDTAMNEAVEYMAGTDEAGKGVYKFAQKIVELHMEDGLKYEQFAAALADHITRVVENMIEPAVEPSKHDIFLQPKKPIPERWRDMLEFDTLVTAKKVIEKKISTYLDEALRQVGQDIFGNIKEHVVGRTSQYTLTQDGFTPEDTLYYTIYYEQQHGQHSNLKEKTIKVFTKAALFGVVSGTILNIVESLYVKALKEGVDLKSAAQGLTKQGDKIHKGAAFLGMIGALKAVMTGAATSIKDVKVGEVDVSFLLLPIFGASFAAVTHPLYARAHLMKVGLANNVDRQMVDAILAQTNLKLSAETLRAGRLGNMGKEAISLPTSVAVSTFVSSVAPGIPLLPDVAGSAFGVLMAAPLERQRRLSMVAPGSSGLPIDADLKNILGEYKDVFNTAREGNFRQAVEAFTKISALKRGVPRAAGTAILTFVCGAIANDLLQKA